MYRSNLLNNPTPTMKAILITLFLSLGAFYAGAQSLVGKWQLVKQTTCIEADLEAEEEDEDTEALVDDMKSRGSAGSTYVVQFKDNKSGEESTQILFKRKDYNSKSFLYKFDGSTLYILDKRSQTISDTYTVEKLEGDSLILSNSSRACDTKVFVKIK
jgi:hypothetical protein